MTRKEHRHYDIAGQRIEVGSLIVYSVHKGHNRCLKFGLVERLTFTGPELEEYSSIHAWTAEMNRTEPRGWRVTKAALIRHIARTLVVVEAQVPAQALALLRSRKEMVDAA